VEVATDEEEELAVVLEDALEEEVLVKLDVEEVTEALVAEDVGDKVVLVDDGVVVVAAIDDVVVVVDDFVSKTAPTAAAATTIITITTTAPTVRLIACLLLLKITLWSIISPTFDRYLDRSIRNVREESRSRIIFLGSGEELSLLQAESCRERSLSRHRRGWHPSLHSFLSPRSGRPVQDRTAS